MVETKVAGKPKAGAAAAAGDKKKAGKARNYDLGNGIYRFSRSRMYHKKALWRFVAKKNPKKEKPKRKISIVKPIGGEKNGGTRVVKLTRKTAAYPTADRVRKHPSRKCFKQHRRYLRQSLTPGTVCILLAGVHKGKRVVFLKQLATGLLLVTGPFGINGVPLRRVNQIYVIGTSTKINISDVKLPENIDDKYFERVKAKKRAKKEEGDIFVAKKEKYKASEQRKTDQKEVDKQVVAAIKKEKNSKLLRKYLGSMFGLHSSQYPHRLKF